MGAAARSTGFYGWRVVHGASVLAAFGWGIGFFGPPVFLSTVTVTTGWSVAFVSAAVTVHFLAGAATSASLPALYRRFGAPRVTKMAALSLGTGALGWALATAPWHLLVAAVVGGAGWGGMSASALNAIVSPWFVRARPVALAMAYNGASVGGVVFSPLWVAAIAALGFPAAAASVALVMVLVMWALADRLLFRTPQAMCLAPDGDAAGTLSITSPAPKPLPGRLLRRDFGFITLCAGMTFGLFAQIGLISHLFSLLAPVLGAQQAGLAMGLVTVMAIAGRTILGWAMPLAADRRLIACLSYAAQLAGSVVFLVAAGTSVPLLMLGVVLFGVGFGNATSLPPLIAQVEFAKDDVLRAVALAVGISQGTYAFAPAIFGLLRGAASTAGGPDTGTLLFTAAAGVQALAIAAFLAGRRGVGWVGRAVA
jgi:Major Facilitator Superfamily